jgi:hypothetical protein
MGTTTGKTPVASAYGTISNDGKTLRISLEEDLTPLGTGDGNAQVLYTVVYQ